MNLQIDSLNINKVKKKLVTLALQESETIQESAKKLGIHPRTLSTYIRTFKISPIITERFKKYKNEKLD